MAGKNLSAFVRMARIIHQRNQAAHFLLVGDGPDRPTLTELVAQHGLEGRFIFTGYASHVGRWLSAMDVFLFPSLSEGLGLSAIEAQVLGIPVVGYSIPGLTEAVAHPDLLVTPGDEEAAALQAAELLGDPARRASLALSARSWTERFSQSAFQCTLEHVYSDNAGTD
jgi:glycosyltransferase involved in cell wall biosynthesis